MPRSAKVASKSATTKRASKRCTSKQPIYEIPESPSQTLISREESLADSIETSSDAGSTTSSSTLKRGRGRSKASDTSATTAVDSDATPTQPISSRNRYTSKEPVQSSIPGFEALEAVNSLYQKLKDSQNELQRLREENEDYAQTLQKQEQHVEELQTELKMEKAKSKKVQQAHEKEAHSARQDAQEQLNTVLSSLRAFSTAAHNIMPLLDVLTGTVDIEYDDATEQLYQILKQHPASVNIEKEVAFKQ